MRHETGLLTMQVAEQESLRAWAPAQPQWRESESALLEVLEISPHRKPRGQRFPAPDKVYV